MFSKYKLIICILLAIILVTAASQPQLYAAEKNVLLESTEVRSMPSSGAKPIPQLTPQGTALDLNNYALAQTSGIILVMEKTSFILCRDIPAQASLPAAIWVYIPGQSALWQEISVYDNDHRLICNQEINQVIKNNSKSKISSGSQTHIPALSQEVQGIPSGTCIKEITVSLKDLEPVKGQPSGLEIAARLIINSKTVELSLNTSLILASLPSYPDWYCGDGHMHSNFKYPGTPVGDDGWHSISQVVDMMKKRGYLWTIMAAHREAFNTQAAWERYWGDCDQAQVKYGIPVCPGTEIASSTDAHALAYWQELECLPPASKKYPETELTTRITMQNPGNSYGGMAHPNHYYKWHTWPPDSRLAELINSSALIEAKTYSQWLASLRNNLPSILKTAQFCAPVGNSDYHFGIPVGCTWLYMPNYSCNERNPVWSAIKTGRTSASGRGNLGCFTLNDYTQGGILRNPDKLKFEVVQKPVTGAHCEQFAIRDKNGNNVWVSPLNPGENTVINLPAPLVDNFFFVHMVFFHDKTGLITSDVITSPVFVDVN